MALGIFARILLPVLWLQIVLAAIDPAQLQIRENDKLLQEKSMLVYGTIMQIPTQMSSVSDGQIVHLAFKAFEAMEQAHQRFRLRFEGRGDLKPHIRDYPKQLPNVITVLAVDNSAYIASSAKGGSSLFYLDPRGDKYATLNPDHQTSLRQFIIQGLAQCRLATVDMPNGGLGHRNGASCGEFMALLAFEQQNQGKLPSAARMVTAQREKGGGIVISPPCNSGRPGKSSFGCTEYTIWPGWEGKLSVIDPTTREADWTIATNDMTLSRLTFA